MRLHITTLRSRVAHSSARASRAPLTMVLLGLGLESSVKFCFIPTSHFVFFLLLPLRLLFPIFLYLTVILLLFYGLSHFLSSAPIALWSLAEALGRKNAVCSFCKNSHEKGRTRTLKGDSLYVHFSMFYFLCTPYCHSLAL